MADAWSLELEDFYQLGKPFPVVAPPLTAAVHQPIEHPCHLIKEVVDAVEVAADTVVIVVPAKLRVESREELVLAHPTVCSGPCVESRQRGAILLAGGPSLEHDLAAVIEPPPKLEAQKLHCATMLPVEPAELDEVRLLFGQFQFERAHPFSQCLIEALGVGLVLEGADEVVRVPTQVRCPSAAYLDGFLEPQIKGIVQIDIRQDR